MSRQPSTGDVSPLEPYESPSRPTQQAEASMGDSSGDTVAGATASHQQHAASGGSAKEIDQTAAVDRNKLPKLHISQTYTSDKSRGDKSDGSQSSNYVGDVEDCPCAGRTSRLAGIFNLASFPQRRTGAQTWKTTFIRGGPLVGLAALLFVLLSIPAAGIILAVSDGQSVESWKVQPNVYLSVFTGVGNKALAFAAAEGAIITWWVRALHGTTFRKLHYDWAAGNNIASALCSRRVSILTATSLCALVILVDGILLQSATTTIQQSLALPLKLQVSLPQEVPANYTGIGAVLDAGNVFAQATITKAFAPVWKDWGAQTPINSPVEGCPGTCLATLRAPALLSQGCNITKTSFMNLTAVAAANGSEGAYPPVCASLGDEAEPDHWCPLLSSSIAISAEALPREQILVAIGIIDRQVGETNAGNFTKRTCMLEPAIAEYPVTIYNNGHVEVNVTNPETLHLANNTAHETTPPYGLFNSTLGGIAALADMRYHSNVLLKIRQDAAWLNSPGPFEQSLIENPEYFYNMDNQNPPILRDPWDEIRAGLNELMFRAAVLAAKDLDNDTIVNLIDPGLPVGYQVDGTRVDARPVFHTRWGFFIGAAAVQIICILLVVATYWKYWTLGRNTSFSPLELAKAFDAPLLRDVEPGLRARHMAEELGERKVRYGVVESAEEGKEGDQPARRLVFEDECRVRSPWSGCPVSK